MDCWAQRLQVRSGDGCRTGGRSRRFRRLQGSPLPFVFEPPLAIAFAATFSSSFLVGPLTVWAQTIRMRVIPLELRGRVFAVLRTAMQGTLPVGGALAALPAAAGGLRAGFLGAVAVIAIPGSPGLVLPALSYDGRSSVPYSEEARRRLHAARQAVSLELRDHFCVELVHRTRAFRN